MQSLTRSDAIFLAIGVLLMAGSFIFMKLFRDTDDALWILPWLYMFGGGGAIIWVVLFFRLVAQE